MILGFSGGREGMNKDDILKVKEFLYKHEEITEVHHGDCVGADSQFHELVRKVNPSIKIIIHPPKYTVFRAFCDGDIQMQEKDYLERNKDIVNASDIIIACPKSKTEVTRSGTWSTIRYARKMKKEIQII